MDEKNKKVVIVVLSIVAVVLIGIVICMVLSSNTSSSINTQTQQPSQTQVETQPTNQEESTQKQSTQEVNPENNQQQNVVVNTIPSCPDCVYVNALVRHYIGDTLKSTDYSTNYKTLLTSKDAYSDKVFLGYVLDVNGKITRHFSCGVESGNAFCIEGGKSASLETDVNTINSVLSCNANTSKKKIECSGSDIEISILKEETGIYTNITSKAGQYCTTNAGEITWETNKNPYSECNAS